MSQRRHIPHRDHQLGNPTAGLAGQSEFHFHRLGQADDLSRDYQIPLADRYLYHTTVVFGSKRDLPCRAHDIPDHLARGASTGTEFAAFVI